MLPPSTDSACGGWRPHNGWLAAVPGTFVSAGSDGFPAPDKHVQSPRFTDMDVPGLGMVRIRYETSSYRHYRSSFWSWHACWADRIDAQGNVISTTLPTDTPERK